MAKNILKEAIADAKAVRQVALANAKAALEEAFTPKLQSMLSAKLSEDLDEDYYEEDMENEGMYDEDMESEGMYDMDEDKDKLEMGETYGMDEEDSMDEEINLEDILNELEMEEGDEEEDEIEEAVGYPNYRADQHQKVKHDADDINQGLNENFDLDSLLKEINDLEDMEEIIEVEDDEMDLTEQSGCGAGMVMNNEGHCMEGHGMMHNMGDMNAMMDPMDDMMEMDYDEDMDEMMYDEDMDEMDMYMDDDMMMETKKGGCGCKKENIKLQETKKAYNTVRTELNEVNLLNSKLLYVNRIFKANNLSEAQKLRVVETLDKASSVKEAKLIYETVKDTFTISKKKKTAPKRSIRENFGMASKATLTSAPRKSVLNESNDMVARMQKLANISKIK